MDIKKIKGLAVYVAFFFFLLRRTRLEEAPNLNLSQRTITKSLNDLFSLQFLFQDNLHFKLSNPDGSLLAQLAAEQASISSGCRSDFHWGLGRYCGAPSILMIYSQKPFMCPIEVGINDK